MALFKKRAARRSQESTVIAGYLGEDIPEGYVPLLSSPEVAACVNRISSIIGSATIRLMRNAKGGDVRVQSPLSRFIDVTPWPDMGTRQSWMGWIVTTLLGDGNGEAFCLPRLEGKNFAELLPMPGAIVVDDPDKMTYQVLWRGRYYFPDEVLHFKLYADSSRPWRGRGVQAQANRIAASLAQTAELKSSLSSPNYKPPLVFSVNSDTELDTEEARDAYRETYLPDTRDGKPWILPGNLMKVEQIRPLSLTDLAVAETVNIDKRTAAAIFGMPVFMLGLGQFNREEYNYFVHTVILPICEGIEQELTAKLLIAPDMYFKFNRRHLYFYDLQTLTNIDLQMADRGFVTGDEARVTAMRDPAGLDEFHALENFIPYEMSGQQSKLDITVNS